MLRPHPGRMSEKVCKLCEIFGPLAAMGLANVVKSEKPKMFKCCGEYHLPEPPCVGVLGGSAEGKPLVSVMVLPLPF